ncbi:MAG: nicotinate (nicotinamide) nucleotide adenylyltransferase [Verrucomicrobiota bacterium]|nr:nicotinate (nicotinamide) nucleotide adenylyltransferase [Verrucomicrobiota bacterium]
METTENLKLETSNSLNRIGLFGGSFDPVHLGHTMVVRTALAEMALDRIFIIPAAQSPFKPEQVPAPATDRLAWLRLAFEDEPRCEIDTQEIERVGISYTIDTVRDYAARFAEAELFYLIGADHVPTLPEWREAAVLADVVTFVVVPRLGELETEVAEFPPSFRGTVLRGKPVAISASDLRERLRAGESIENFVPPAVAAALKVEHSY